MKNALSHMNTNHLKQMNGRLPYQRVGEFVVDWGSMIEGMDLALSGLGDSFQAGVDGWVQFARSLGGDVRDEPRTYCKNCNCALPEDTRNTICLGCAIDHEDKRRT